MYLPRPLSYDCGLTQTFSTHIVHELMLAPTCAHTCIVAYMTLYTIVCRIFLCTIHTHQLYMRQTIHLSDDGTNTLTHKHCHMHMHSIQFNCTCACLYRPLILCQFVYQAFCSCIVSPRIECIVSPSGPLNIHCTLA